MARRVINQGAAPLLKTKARRGAALLALALLAGTATAAAPQRNKAVHVSVSAPWSATPLALEASEFFSPGAPGESGHLFWEYARALPAVVGKSDKEQYEAAIATAAPLVSADQLNLLKYALAIRQFSPKVQAHRTLWPAAEAAGCSMDGAAAVAVVDGRKCVSDPGKGLEKALNAAAALNESGAVVHDLDHEYAGTSAPNPPSVVVHLYATLGSESFQAFHKVLAKEAASNKIRYVVRHAWPAGGDGKQTEMQVQGYGVEMAIKNMEYKAVDDQKKEGGVSSSEDGEEEEDVVAGFDFKVLLQRKPEREVELLSLRDSLLSEARKAEGTDIKVWALKDLGVQASQRILQSEDPLRLIRDLSHNLPALVNTISRIRVNATIRSELEGNRQYMHPGTNMIYVNGRKLHLDALTPYKLFDFIKHEIKMMDSIKALGLDTRSSRKILNAPSDDDGMGMGGEEQAFKLDIKHEDHVFWVNDIEKDDMYKQWPRSLQALLQRGWPGQLRYVRRNLWTAIYMIDPSSVAGLAFISDVLNQVVQQVPVRFGFVFKSSALSEEALPPGEKTEETESTALLDPGVAFHRLFCALYVRHGNRAAFEFGDGYYRKAVAGEHDGDAAAKARRDAMKEIFTATAKRYRTDKGKAKYGRDLKNATMDDLLRRSTAFARNSGVGTAVPAAVVNGVVLEGEALNEQQFYYVLQTQMVEMQRMTYFGQMDENKDIYEQYINRGGPAHRRFHKLIVPGPESSSDMLQLTKAAPTAAEFAKQMARVPAVVCGEDTGALRALTHLVAADMGEAEGCAVVEQAFYRLVAPSDETCPRTRLMLLDNSKEATGSEAMAVMQGLMRKPKVTSMELRVASKAICKALKEGDWNAVKSSAEFAPLLEQAATRVGGQATAGDDKGSKSSKTNQKEKEAAAAAAAAEPNGVLPHEEQRQFVAKLFGMEPGASAVATSGRIFKVGANISFLAGDFGLAEGTEWKSRCVRLSRARSRARALSLALSLSLSSPSLFSSLPPSLTTLPPVNPSSSPTRRSQHISMAPPPPHTHPTHVHACMHACIRVSPMHA